MLDPPPLRAASRTHEVRVPPFHEGGNREAKGRGNRSSARIVLSSWCRSVMWR
jgi:hypothetical protein